MLNFHWFCMLQTMATQSLDPIMVRPQFNPKTIASSLFSGSSTRKCIFVIRILRYRLLIIFVLRQNLVPLPIQQMLLQSFYKQDMQTKFSSGSTINHNTFYGNFYRHIAFKFEKVGPAFSSINTRPSLLFVDIGNRIN